MSENKIYRYLFEKLYKKSERESVFIYEMLVTRTIQLIDLLSKAKTGRPDVSSYDIDFDIMHLKFTVTEVVDRFSSSGLTDNEYMSALKQIFLTSRSDPNNTVDCNFYMSEFINCMCSFGLIDENIRYSMKMLSMSLDSIRDIPESTNKRSLIVNTISIFVNTFKNNLEKEEYFISLNKMHDMYNHVRWLYMHFDSEESYSVYLTTSAFMLGFLCKYNYHYSEIISFIMMNVELDDIDKKIKKKLISLKLEPFGKMALPDAYALYESKNCLNDYYTGKDFYERPEVELNKIFQMREDAERHMYSEYSYENDYYDDYEYDGNDIYYE